jgi:type II secretory pathway pseudopilin PulG
MTLIEILVVISIILILFALSSAALQKTRITANYSRTSESINKLQRSLAAEVDRVNSRARAAQIDPVILAYCDGNNDRARSLYLALEQRKYFPDNFADANAPAYIVTDTNGAFHLRLGGTLAGDTVYYIHKSAPVFAEVSGLPAPGGTDESGALLYIILAKQSVAGGGAMASAADDLSSAQRLDVAFGSVTRQTFADGWRRSIGFNRWNSSPEAQSSDYVNQHGASPDPLDPKGLLAPWNATTLMGWNSYKQSEVAGLLQFTGQNRITTVYSLGNNVSDPTDDVVGFRILRAGNKGY